VTTDAKTAPHIGTLRESSLHAGIKTWFAQPGDLLEAPLDGYVIDLVRGRHLYEIQTRNFSSMRTKLAQLLESYQLTIIYPLARDKWIQRVSAEGEIISRRKSPKHCRSVHAFQELIRIPQSLSHPNFHLTLVFTHEEEIWVDDGQGSWRRKFWSIHDHHLIEVVDHIQFHAPQDYTNLLPDSLPQPFSNRDLAGLLKCPLRLAQKMTYTLRSIGQLERAGKQGRAHLFRRIAS